MKVEKRIFSRRNFKFFIVACFYMLAQPSRGSESGERKKKGKAFSHFFVCVS